MSSAYFSGTSGDRFLDVVELYSGASRLSKSLQEDAGRGSAETGPPGR